MLAAGYHDAGGDARYFARRHASVSYQHRRNFKIESESTAFRR